MPFHRLTCNTVSPDLTHDKAGKNNKKNSSAAIARVGITIDNVGQAAGSVPSLSTPGRSLMQTSRSRHHAARSHPWTASHRSQSSRTSPPGPTQGQLWKQAAHHSRHPGAADVFILNTRAKRRPRAECGRRSLPYLRSPCPAIGCWSASPSSDGPSATSPDAPGATRPPSSDGPRASRPCRAKRPLGWKN